MALASAGFAVPNLRTVADADCSAVACACEFIPELVSGANESRLADRYALAECLIPFVSFITSYR